MSTALLILGALAVGMAANLVVLGALRHERTQRVAYAELRQALARGTAPVGQTDLDGDLLALGTPVAILQAPAIGVDEVVFEGTTAGVLTSGPGHRRDTVLPGQAGVSVVMGRRAAFGGPFSLLGQLGPGSEVTVTTGQGVHTYEVTGVRRAGDPVPPPPARGEGRLTLITADGAPFVPDDVVRVDAELTSEVVPAPARAIAPAALPEAEAALAGDEGALVALVLWAQVLVAAALVVAWAGARWGRWQAWLVGVPVLVAVGVAVSDQVAQLLPNLL